MQPSAFSFLPLDGISFSLLQCSQWGQAWMRLALFAGQACLVGACLGQPEILLIDKFNSLIHCLEFRFGKRELRLLICKAVEGMIVVISWNQLEVWHKLSGVQPARPAILSYFLKGFYIICVILLSSTCSSQMYFVLNDDLTSQQDLIKLLKFRPEPETMFYFERYSIYYRGH